MEKCDEDSRKANKSLQDDEIEALSSIFYKEWVTENVHERVYSINIKSSSGSNVYLQIMLPEHYPLECPPTYCISAPWMTRISKNQLCSEIEDVYLQNPGESIIYLWIEKVKDFIENISSNTQPTTTNCSKDSFVDPDDFENTFQASGANPLTAVSLTLCENEELPLIQHGEPITDRKSVFQAHVAKVVSVDQVNRVLMKLKENRKVAIATHNIFAYRISRDKGSFIQDFDDDGESKAGSVLLHLLQILGVCDVLIIVSRWYGGIHLGSDRFKHISNTARNILTCAGYIEDKPQSTPKKLKKKKICFGQF